MATQVVKTDQITKQAIQKQTKKRTIPELIQASLKELGKALPAHLNAERLGRIALTTLRLNPALAECTPESFLGALFQSAQLGLEPNIEGQAYLIPYTNSKKVDAFQFMKYNGFEAITQYNIIPMFYGNSFQSKKGVF